MASAVAAPARSPRFGLVHVEPASHVFGAVEGLDRGVPVPVLLHLDEAETPRSARLTIEEHLGGSDHAMVLEEFLEILRK
jgi:hypothetical protein